MLEEVGSPCKVKSIFKIIHFYNQEDNNMSIHYFFHIELLGDPSRQENEHTLQAKWFDRNGIDASMVRGNVIFDHIDSFLKAKKRNSFYPIDQLFQTDSQEMELTSKLCIRTQ